MEDDRENGATGKEDQRALIREAIQEFLGAEQSRREPAYKAELLEERKRREQLERQVNELVEENRRSRHMAEESERVSAIRMELQRLGVAKMELAFRAVKDDIHRSEDGRLIAHTDAGELGAKEYLSQFLAENPELLPARMVGGSGASAGQKPANLGNGVDLDRIRPGMSAEELERARQEIARIAGQGVRSV